MFARFATQIVFGRKNSQENPIQSFSDKVKLHNQSQHVFLVSPVILVTSSAAGFGWSLGGQQDPEDSHSCSTVGVKCVPGPQDGGRDEEKSRRRFPTSVGGRRKGNQKLLGPQKSVEEGMMGWW